MRPVLFYAWRGVLAILAGGLKGRPKRIRILFMQKADEEETCLLKTVDKLNCN